MKKKIVDNKWKELDTKSIKTDEIDIEGCVVNLLVRVGILFFPVPTILHLDLQRRLLQLIRPTASTCDVPN